MVVKGLVQMGFELRTWWARICIWASGKLRAGWMGAPESVRGGPTSGMREVGTDDFGGCLHSTAGSNGIVQEQNSPEKVFGHSLKRIERQL